MDIPDKAVGFVIGKGGENIKRITSSTNARVQINPGAYFSNTEWALDSDT
jgi:polyribonucleotide nucleotidyltransferase